MLETITIVFKNIHINKKLPRKRFTEIKCDVALTQR